MSSRSDVNLVLVGRFGVGKTSLILTYTTNAFPGYYVPIRCEDYSGTVLIDENPVNVRIRDTAHQVSRIL